MKTALFTKLFGSAGVDVVEQTAAELGFDGVDLLVRDGFPAAPSDPQSVAKHLAHLSRTATPVLTATTDMTDPDSYPVDAVLGALADGGVSTVRVGYWYYDATQPYRDVLDTAREQLTRLAEIAEKRQVVLLVQLHGGTIHASGALAQALLRDTDPAVVGSYIDPGNQSVQDGREDWRLTFDLLGARLRCVGVKNGGWSLGALSPSGQRQWRSDWLGVADGMVPWDDIVGHLRETSFDGVLSFHGHYELPLGQVVDQTRTDHSYIRRLLEAAA